MCMQEKRVFRSVGVREKSQEGRFEVRKKRQAERYIKEIRCLCVVCEFHYCHDELIVKYIRLTCLKER